MGGPKAEYETRLASRRASVQREKARKERLGNVRLGFVLLAGAAIWAAGANGFRAWPAAALLAVFVLIASLIQGERLERSVLYAGRAVEFYQRALLRVETRRDEAGETGERFIDPHHPYSVDLDLFGRHSLFQLLSTCRTRAGENRLAGWLLAPAGPEEIRSRHEAVDDLCSRLDLREDLAVLGQDFRSGVHPEALSAWATAPEIRVPPGLRIAAAILSGLGLFVLAAWTLTLFANPRLRIAVIVVALIEAAVFFRWREAVSSIAHATEEPGHDLALLSAVLGRLEKEQFTSDRLRRAQQVLLHPKPASAAIADLRRLIDLLDSRDNLFLRIFGPLLLWTTQVSFAVEAWRKRHGGSVPGWLDAVAELEALSSLANPRFEHPEDTFPEVIAQGSDGPLFEARGLSHPLLHNPIANDLSIGKNTRLLMVSGSNMSGKSTLLRTIGLNAVLALAGAPVRAEFLRLSPFSIGASIRTSDSLDGGVSRFYAEILRVRHILDLPFPSLYLLDELLAGTNSHDRRIGAAAILRALRERGAIGLATTHDLALSAMAGEFPDAVNVHFEDAMVDGRIHFDYRMRPGVVTRSNALELMRSVGLEV